jgi:putative oxidoreductase
METAATLIVIGRVIFGGFFLIAGARNFWAFSERKTTATTNYGWQLPAPVMAVGFAIQLFGGLALILGIWTVWASLALIAFLVLATALYHNLFMFQGKERDPHLYLTLVNITLAGGLLLVIAEAL